jgi:hypothetical protein
LRKHKVITVTLNTLHDVEYFRVDDRHWHSRSVATRIAEVADAGESGEHELPVGNDSGFLWRMDSWWRYEQVEGGVIIESESVSLTRDIPTGLGWLIGPFVTSIPKESLRMMLENTRMALGARAAAGKHSTTAKAAPASRRTKKPPSFPLNRTSHPIAGLRSPTGWRARLFCDRAVRRESDMIRA